MFIEVRWCSEHEEEDICWYMRSTQPDPVVNDKPYAWDLVLHDMAERDRIGYERYNTRLQPHNGRDALLDAYQEALDMVVYLRQAIYERDGQ